MNNNNLRVLNLKIVFESVLDNLEKNVIKDFGYEWKTYNQSEVKKKELLQIFNNYFDIFPFHKINKNSVGFDMGCGSGRWSQFIAPKVKTLNCIDPSDEAIQVAKKNLKRFKNCKFQNSGVMDNSLKENSQDFGYSLGVLHHTKDTRQGIKNCVKKLKKGAPFLIYLYYKFDNKPTWFKAMWRVSNFFRNIISKMPFSLKVYITKLIALLIYYPLARLSSILESYGIDVKNIPLSYYRKSSLYTMQTDSLDRFGTKLEQRFTKDEIYRMMDKAGLVEIKFSNKIPYWVAVGIKS